MPFPRPGPYPRGVPEPTPPDRGVAPGAATRSRHDGPRWAALLAVIGGGLVAAAPFLPWVRIEAGEAERFGRELAVAARAEAQGGATPGLADLGDRLAERHVLTGMDLVQWSRQARERLADVNRTGAAASPRERERLARFWLMVPVLVLGLAATGAVLAATLLAHLLKRYRTPLQVLTGVVSVLAGALAGGWAWLLRPLSNVATLEGGHGALLWGGALTLAAVVGALRWASVAMMLFTLLVTLLALAALGWVWLGLPT